MVENPRNPRTWRYSWDTHSHSPYLRLCLSSSLTNPRLQCKNLNAHLILPQSLLLVSWFDEGDEEEKKRDEVSLKVPVPRVLIDAESPVSFRALGDHVEVKLVLLLPVDHPVVSGFGSILNSSENEANEALDMSKPLVMNSDLKSLSSMGGVHFYCRNCSTRLTRNPLQVFSEMPSVNWREVADNWFGTCCCSFGGISEKIVTKYANSYTCAKGACLLSTTTVSLSKDDLEECQNLSESNCTREDQFEPNINISSCLSKVKLDYDRNQENITGHDNQSANDFERNEVDNAKCSSKVKSGMNGEKTDLSKSCLTNEALPGCCYHGKHDNSENSGSDFAILNGTELATDKKFLLNGFLEDIFMGRPSNISRNVKWTEFCCHQCSFLLGAYPSGSDDAPIDGGVQLFKCYISTCAPAGGSADLFRKYTLERMFTNQLVESAKDELSFQVVVKDLANKDPLFQVVLLNPNSWSCTGYCSSNGDNSAELASKAELYPHVKVLFSDCTSSTESQLRVLGDLVKKNTVDEVFVLKRQGEELIGSLKSANRLLPPSCAYLQGLTVSSMPR